MRLDHMDALLPGPKTTIAGNFASPGEQLIPQFGTDGVTSVQNGHITIGSGPTPQVGIERP